MLVRSPPDHPFFQYGGSIVGAEKLWRAADKPSGEQQERPQEKPGPKWQGRPPGGDPVSGSEIGHEGRSARY